MEVYLIDENTDVVIYYTPEVSVIYGKELHFKRQGAAKALSKFLQDYRVEISATQGLKEPIFAVDIPNSVVVIQKNVTVVCSEIPLNLKVVSKSPVGE